MLETLGILGAGIIGCVIGWIAIPFIVAAILYPVYWYIKKLMDHYFWHKRNGATSGKSIEPQSECDEISIERLP